LGLNFSLTHAGLELLQAKINNRLQFTRILFFAKPTSDVR